MDLGRKPRSCWAPEENAYLARHFGRYSDQEIAYQLNRSPASLRVQASKLRIKRAKERATEPLPLLREPIKKTTQDNWPSIMKQPPYTCPELLRNPGIPASRFTAYELPSRDGRNLRYRDGRVEVAA